MSENSPSSKKQISPDWFVQGILTKLGDTFDRLTGRGWKPSSSLATSELIEKLKRLVDSESRESDDKRRFVPHNIKLKMQWDKFSTDSDDSLKKLETELLTALIDHINDKRYYTYAPITLEVKADYFTNGVKLFAGFEKSGEEDREAEIDVSVPGSKPAADALGEKASVSTKFAKLIVRFSVSGRNVQRDLSFEIGKRLSIGRTKENDIAVEDASVSKIHASLMLNSEGQFIVADTGSTNGTFIDGKRISYGKAMTFETSQKLMVGTVELTFETIQIPMPIGEVAEDMATEPEAYKIGEFEFTGKIDRNDSGQLAHMETLPSSAFQQEGTVIEQNVEVPNPTVPSIDIDPSADDTVTPK
jgi:pSer/pThr/pTyr-binding forkhead associated (FHA) protein